MAAPGSSELTAEQQQWYLDHFGERYVAVQENHLRQSRRVRRAKVKKGIRHVAPADTQAANAQHDVRARLGLNPLKARA